MIKLKLPKINIPLSILVLVFGAIVIANFPTTWYTGWDNLHPEFNFGLNLSRTLSSVWQSNQGLGTYGGHGYAATLPHTALLFIMSILIPDMYLRSIFTFICLFFGALGVFYLLRKLLSARDNQVRDMSSLFGGLFYMLNYATVQNFYIQLEAFIVHFAALPWLFLALINYLEKRSTKRLFVFLIISFVTSIQGFIPPLFAVYFLLLAMFLFFYILKEISIQKIKTSILILVLTILMNSYWLIPVGYYTFSRSETYLNSYNNLSSTEDFIDKNRKYGTLNNIIQFRGFLSEAIDVRTDGVVFKIFSQWEDHMSRKSVQIIGISMFLVVIIGSSRLILKRDLDNSLFFLFGFLFIFTLLATDTFPFSRLSDFLQNLPVFKQAFRITFTKFSISFVFFFSILFGIGAYTLLSYISKFGKERLKNATLLITASIILGSIIFLSLPMFSGNLLYSRTKVNIPGVYFQLFDFFGEKDKTQRIANLPQGWNWGWSVYKWGYSGSGFLWYGIEQPIMDRSFDVWGKTNENYYWELYYAIFSQRFDLLDSIMEKYQVNWLVFDNNISPYLNPYEFTYVTDLKRYIDSSDKFKLVKVLKDNNPKVKDIYVYEVKLTKKAENYKSVFSPGEIKNIGPSYTYNNADYAFNDFGNYYTDRNKPFDAYYIFRSIFDNRRLSEFPLGVKENESTVTLTTDIPNSVVTYPLVLPSIDQNFDGQQPRIELINKELSVQFNKIIQDSYNSKDDKHFLNHEASGCEKPKTPSAIFKQEVTKNKNLRFITYDSENCYAIILDRISQRNSYLIQVESKNIEGRPLQFAVINHDSRKADVDLKLPKNEKFQTDYLFLPPMKQYGAGYSLYFQGTSIGKKMSVNEIRKITSYTIPYQFLSRMVFVNPDPKKDYKKTLAFFQSYDPGWKAYEMVNSQSSIVNGLSQVFPFLFGKPIGKHVLVNNWANGWILDSSIVNGQPASPQGGSSIVIIYLPQYLQYIGFILTFGTLVYLLYLLKKARGGASGRDPDPTSLFELRGASNRPARRSFSEGGTPSVDLSARLRH